MITTDRLAQAFSIAQAPATDEYRFGTVGTVNPDGSVYVGLGLDREVSTRCTCLYDAAVGDRVQVCIKANGQAVVLGSIGKEKAHPSYYRELDDASGYYELYSNASGNQGSVTLNESAANFKFLDIYFKKPEVGYGFQYARIYEPNGQGVTLTNSRIPSTQIVSKLVTISGSTITVNTSYAGYWNSNGSTGAENSIAIYRVIGYK